MTRRINFVMGFHIHQPVGNFESVFEYATKVSYRPLIEALHRHPNIPFALHISGPVWEYWEQHAPDMFDLIRQMVDRGQCELLGGGFYEPILAVIPPEDAAGQLEMMNDYLYQKFGVIPAGIWLTERIWEPHLPTLLARAGVKFLAVDDYHLKSVGVAGEKLLGYFVTEDVGNRVNIFPISEVLRYTMPFAPVEKTMDYLRSVADDFGRRLVVFADDGEKFGLWPGTEKWVWKEGWMEKFLSELERNRHWINILTFSEALEKLRPAGRVYMPTCSYFEMSEWTLPPDLSYEFHKFVEELKESGRFEQLRPFIKGGFWRNFLAKYHESNWMHKRMLWISGQIRARRRRLVKNRGKALKSLFRAQCNCAYWHGVFGGLYLPHLREGIWTNLIEAEGVMEAEAPTRPITITDVDADGNDEIRLGNREVSLWIAPSRGGAIEEISFFPAKVNLVNTLARHREGYHKLLWEAQHGEQSADDHASIHDRIVAKEKGLEKILHYDWHPRRFAQEHFLFTFVDEDSFATGNYTELGDFTTQPYELVSRRSVRGEASVTLRREGALYHEGKIFPIVVTKKIRLAGPGNHLFVEYEIENQSEWREFMFAVETNFSLLSRDDPNRYFKFPHETLNIVHPGDRMVFADVDGYELVDESRKFRVSFRGHSDLVWLFPIETVSNSEGGFERVYQETAVVHIFKFYLNPGEKFTAELMWKIESL